MADKNQLQQIYIMDNKIYILTTLSSGVKSTQVGHFLQQPVFMTQEAA